MSEESSHYAPKYAEHNDWQLERGRRLLAVANPKEGQSVLDVGCGTGELSLDLARAVSRTGRVFALDPDRERLKIARASVPPEIDNIVFLEEGAEEIKGVESASVDLAFSNYVLQWIADKGKALREIARCLRTDERLVMECVAGWPPEAERITKTMGKNVEEIMLAIRDRQHFIDQDQWMRLFHEHGFIVEHIGTFDVRQEFADLATFHDWFEATTHGLFRREMLTDDSMRRVREEYPGKVVYDMQAFQAVVQKR
uniref:Methyltransferase domain-containing protein n=1 Tax=Candidatus Kentrum sp. DK TaxID=2126562 RepID=A0A450S8M8_9GAMM|nr:MAG: Methyltransferase domain-containing protein [Candidatus Kentron sp. DK]